MCRLEIRKGDRWVKLKNYSRISQRKAEFYLALCDMMVKVRPDVPVIRVVHYDP